jgi:hypothetical protein
MPVNEINLFYDPRDTENKFHSFQEASEWSQHLDIRDLILSLGMRGIDEDDADQLIALLESKYVLTPKD